jgi:hypothetical protein
MYGNGIFGIFGDYQKRYNAEPPAGLSMNSAMPLDNK